MAELSPVETLRAAAERLRTLRSAATNGPWEAHDDGLVWPQKPSGPGDPVSGSTEPDDAAWIALVHPGIAEPLAALLDEALRYARLPQTNRYPIVVHALALARVLLGVPDA